MKEQENLNVTVKDEYKMGDSFDQKDEKQKTRPRGYVYIYSTPVNEGEEAELLDYREDNPIDDGDNLIAYPGREWVASRIFGVNNTNITAEDTHFICWFGIGSGGAPAGDPFTPSSPTLSDSSLDTALPISETNTNYGDDRGDGYYKKQLESVDFDQDEDNNNRWLTAKATFILDTDDANWDDPINEAGLFIAETDSSGHNGPFTLFSRITFSSFQKTSTRKITFVWYVYT